MTGFRKMIAGANWKIYKKSCQEANVFARDLRKYIKSFRTGPIDVYILATQSVCNHL